MKIAITGHTSGIGKYLFDELSKDNEVIGYSRTNMFDISDMDMRMKLFMDVMEQNPDVFINNAYSSANVHAQTEVFKGIYNAWERKSDKTIINVGTKGVLDTESERPYITSKTILRDLHLEKLTKVGRKCRLIHVSPSYTDTPMIRDINLIIGRHPVKLTAKEVGDIIIMCINMPEHVEISDIMIPRTDESDY